MIALTLPFPPTMNTYWRHVLVNGRPRTLISARGRTYRGLVAARRLEQAPGKGYPLGQRLRVAVTAYGPDKRARDLDNLLKATLDALQLAGVFESDSQIDRLEIRRGPPDPPTGHLEVVVAALDEPADGA